MEKKNLGSGTRQNKRIEFEVPVYFNVDKSMGKNVRLTRGSDVLKGMTQNINSKGVALVTDMFLPTGTRLDMEIKLEKSEDKEFIVSMDVIGRIASVRAIGNGMYRMGIAFVDIDELDRKALDKYMKKQIDRLG
ncbi:MAG: PilZ domain-containing protein [bacterium]